jgi:pyruvate/2-oxoglutarate dehydrogenase complex dihydrolipoamide acyltransferase (E2) component
MDACYHHLYEYGSIGIFGVIGRPVPDPGSPTSGPDRRRTMTLRWTFDERCEDGLVAGYALKRCKQMLEDPRGMGLPDPSIP